VDFKGLSGNVAFKEGDRSSLKIDVTRLVQNGWKRVGMWTPDKLLNITKPKAFWDSGATNVTLVVTCVLVWLSWEDYSEGLFITDFLLQEEPYVKLREGRNWTGNDRFEGFSIELLKKIAEKVHFKYVLEGKRILNSNASTTLWHFSFSFKLVVQDQKYGVFDQETHEWNGVVRQLIDKVINFILI
jgi:ionotropic glutamate receptor